MPTYILPTDMSAYQQPPRHMDMNVLTNGTERPQESIKPPPKVIVIKNRQAYEDGTAPPCKMENANCTSGSEDLSKTAVPAPEPNESIKREQIPLFNENARSEPSTIERLSHPLENNCSYQDNLVMDCSFNKGENIKVNKQELCKTNMSSELFFA